MTKTLLLSLAAATVSVAVSAQRMAAIAPLHAPGEDSPVTIKANLINKGGKADGAVASFQVPGNGTYEIISSNSYFKDNIAGFWAPSADGQGKLQYFFTQFEELFGTIYANFDAYSASTWERTLHVNKGLLWTDRPADLTFSQKDHTAYGVFADGASHKATTLASLDLTTGKATSLATLPETMVTIAAHDGHLYTISDDGTLYYTTVPAVDGGAATVAAPTAVGKTGLTPNADKVQSATCDPATGVIYWAAQLMGGESALYAIDPTTATATKVYDFPNREQWVGLFIEGDDVSSTTDPDQPDTPDPENPDQPDPDKPTVHENSYFEDFEDCDGNYYHEWLPYGWEDRSALGHEGLNPDNWQSQQNLTWQVGSIAQGTGHPAYAGNYCAFINVSTAWSGHPNEAQDEWLITPAVKTKADEYLFFQLSYSPGWTRWNRQAWDYSGENNKLEVHISTDGGETWKKLWDVMDHARQLSDEELEADRSTTAHPYIPMYVDLKDYANQEVRFAFRYVGIGGQGMSLDDVTVGLPIPVAHYSLPDGIYREALSPRMTYAQNPVLWAPAGTEITWTSQCENAQEYTWTYDGGSASSTNVTTPAYTAGSIVDVPSLQVSFGQNKSLVFTDNYRRMQIEGNRFDFDDEGNKHNFGIANYDALDPNAYVGFNRTFGFDQDSYDKWSGLCGRMIYTVVPSCAISAYSAPLKPYVINEIYANVKVEAIDPATEISCDVWVTDETGTYITDCIANGHLLATDIESLYPGDEQNASWSVMRFDFKDQPIYVDRKIYVMIGGFNLDTDAVYFPGISTSTPENQAESYFGVIDYNDDANGIFRLFDVNSYNIGTTGRRHIAGFLIGLDASYDIPTGINTPTADAPAADATLYDLQGRRLNERPATGLYIQNGRKHIAK